MQGRDVVVGGTTEMWERLFGSRETWGWEFTPPAPVTVSPEAATPPVAEQVYAPHDYQLREKRSKRAWLGLLGWIALTFVLVVMLDAMMESVSKQVPLAAEIFASVVFGVGVLLAVIHFFRTRRRFTVLKRSYESHYNRALESYKQAHFAWQQRVAEHDRRERDRVGSAMLWQPVKLGSRPNRIDVFGGTEDGWASLLATSGAAQLAAGASMLLLDLTDMAVGDDLATAAAGKGYEVAVHELPRDLGAFGLLADLDPHELAEVLAEAMHNLNRTAMGADLRGLHADLLATVAERLSGPVTFTKLVAGLQVLRRVYDAGSDETLSADELRKLNSYVDTVGNTEQVRNELIALEGEIRGLARAEQAQDTAPTGFRASWPVRGLSVVATRTKIGRHKRFLDHVVFHRALQELHTRDTTGREVLVVAGADQIGLEALEAMAQQARRAGVRLVFLLRHLRDDLRKLLGGAGSVSLLMQLGNAEEAAAAAEYIGRGFKFVLSQLTEEMGKTFTHGTASSQGGSVGTSHSRGYTFGTNSSYTSGSGGNSSSTMGTSSSRTTTNTTTRERNWQETVNQSEGISRSEGETMARVYEFQVEPTALQSLAPTAFVLVEAGPGGRRVVMGDCNPGIVLLDRVARDALPR
ncbi:hypothetical protein [Amycolatopsis australiensis]|uniref:Uncharacterized protein n=1 Tax=Amycolatopsis australiensis TaxID=546364 RepID=A0A1K1PTG9_9PSEU|nr:hypothetical protein [Amycolatopsis australiensis]SFW50102.1 hypothetical protein SAMN04489730_0918 [Amycolatopsis australiensis]